MFSAPRLLRELYLSAIPFFRSEYSLYQHHPPPIFYRHLKLQLHRTVLQHSRELLSLRSLTRLVWLPLKNESSWRKAVGTLDDAWSAKMEETGETVEHLEPYVRSSAEERKQPPRRTIWRILSWWWKTVFNDKKESSSLWRHWVEDHREMIQNIFWTEENGVPRKVVEQKTRRQIITRWIDDVRW